MVAECPREQEVFPSHRNPDLAHPRQFSQRKMPRSTDWAAADPELKRKKRVAKYKMFSVETKVKDTVRSSYRWIKHKLMEMRYA